MPEVNRTRIGFVLPICLLHIDIGNQFHNFSLELNSDNKNPTTKFCYRIFVVRFSENKMQSSLYQLLGK